MKKSQQQKKRLSRKSRPASRQSKAMVNPQRLLMPPTFDTTLIYSDYYNLATGAASYATYPFRLNSCRDPYAGVGGGSCSGFVEFSGFYQKYKVTKCSFETFGYNTCTTAVLVGVFARSSYGAALSSGAECQQMLLERPDRTRYSFLKPYGSGTSYPEFKMTYALTPAQCEGRLVGPEEDYNCTFNTEPNLQCYFDLVFVSADGAATGSTSNAFVKISYSIHCYQRAQEYTD